MMGESNRDSMNTNATAMDNPNAKKPMVCGELHSYWTPPHDSARRIGMMAQIRAIIPG